MDTKDLIGRLEAMNRVFMNRLLRPSRSLQPVRAAHGRTSNIVLCGLLVAIAACSKDPSSATKLETPAALQPAPTRTQAVKTASDLPAGPAILEPITEPDPCALIGDQLLHDILGEGALKIDLKRLDRTTLADLMEKKTDSLVTCEWNVDGHRAEVTLGSEHSTHELHLVSTERITGLGDEAWFETKDEQSKRVRVRLGDRYLVVTTGSGKRSDMMAMARAATAALPGAPALSSHFLRGGAVGAKAVNPCDLASAEVLAKVHGGGSYVPLPRAVTGNVPGQNYVACHWSVGDLGGFSVRVVLHDAAYWESMSGDHESTAPVAGHEARLNTGYPESLEVHLDSWTLEVGLAFEEAPAVRRERVVVLAEAVIAALAK